MLNTVIKGTRTIEEYKMVRDAMEGLTKMYSEMHMQACDEWKDGDPVKTWYDSDGNLCIEYESGRWWHYFNGEWW